MPVLDTLELLILSVDQVQGLAELLGTDLSAADDDAFFAVMSRLQQKVKCRRVAMCRKTRDEGIQCRWSLMVEADIQCKSAPIYHVPKDECGGGSACAAKVASLLVLQAWRRAASPRIASRQAGWPRAKNCPRAPHRQRRRNGDGWRAFVFLPPAVIGGISLANMTSQNCRLI